MAAAAELKYYRSQTVSDAAGNGGRMSSNQIISAALANLFPAVQGAERLAGSTKRRKLFCKAAFDDDRTLLDTRIFVDQRTPANDRIYIFPGTQTNVQSELTGSERVYGCGLLNANVIAGATTMDVLVENFADAMLVTGDLVRISDKTPGDLDSAGSEEFVTITGSITNVSNVATFTFTPALGNGYSTANTRVMSVYQAGDVVGSISNMVVTTAGSGDFDVANILPDSIGSIEQTWTLTWTSATAFGIVGDTVGSVGSGSNGAGASPNNSAFSKPYFVLQTAGFSGVWASGDTLVFKTHPAAVPMWAKRVVPAGSAAYAPNSLIVVMKGETVGA